ncbi:MAG TPA: MBL fold metallo-hydrolase [Longimicrobiales bacterium]|nr:MBL fold metallo-hydrolase [Longimicrobiales bacterium]
MDITFLGAAGTVTGSRYLLRAGGARILVDCGLFQGLKQLRLRNRAPFPEPPAGLDAIVLTHAHLDHSGYIPLLARNGFAGPVYCTPATAELCGVLLPDSGHLQEEEAAFANRRGYSKHHPALALYTRADAERSLELLRPVPLDAETPAAPGISFRFSRAGHILGAASARVSAEGRAVLFSGDLGRPDDPVLRPPAVPQPADYVVVEATYGARRHPAEDPRAALAEVIRRTAARGGVVVIPSFAVGRAQSLLVLLGALRAEGAIPALPIFLDSPMAADATRILLRYPDEHRLSAAECAAAMDPVTIVRDVEGSKDIDRRHGPMIVISASGMATGGRILFHLERFAPEPRNTILLVGYQAAGTRGAALQAGARELKMHGAYVPVRSEVVMLEGLSAHADADELLAWLCRAPRPPRQVFVTHGEPVAADVLRHRIEEELRWPARAPLDGESVTLE